MCRRSSITKPCGPAQYSVSGTRNRRRCEAVPSPPSVATQSTKPGRSFEVIAELTTQSWAWASRNRHRSEEHSSELQSLMRISYAVFCLKKRQTHDRTQLTTEHHKWPV